MQLCIHDFTVCDEFEPFSEVDDAQQPKKQFTMKLYGVTHIDNNHVGPPDETNNEEEAVHQAHTTQTNRGWQGRRPCKCYSVCMASVHSSSCVSCRREGVQIAHELRKIYLSKVVSFAEFQVKVVQRNC